MTGAARRSLADWLAYIERQHPQPIALGLERVRRVLDAMDAPIRCPVITVTGTNGKGSTCAMLESILGAAGYRTGHYASPHLLRYNERVRIAGREADDAALCEGFEAVERARGDVPLTYFEFGTLCAFHLFSRAKLDALVLEVGLGGRLDAVNLLDADCAVLTGVGIDHTEFLGPDRESIGHEKAGIFRAGRPAIVADPEPPASVLASSAELRLLGRDFDYRPQGTQWTWWTKEVRRSGLAWPALRGGIQLRNASAAMAALDALKDRLPVAMQDVRRGLAEATVPGRFQVLPGRPQTILDVAHNPQAAAVLAANLGESGFAPETLAVFGMLKDKDIAGVIRAVAPRITRWHVAPLPGPRGASATQLEQALRDAGVAEPVTAHASVHEALAAARAAAGENDKIVAFGSFLTVAESLTAAGAHG